MTPNRPASSPRTRARLSRTFSRGRFAAYRSLLHWALAEDYAVVSLERFLDDPAARAAPRVLILRHDVDQHPASALVMAEIERSLGVRSTWYLRWRTADAGVIARLRANGGDVGLHYETLTRATLKQRIGDASAVAELVEPCRHELRAEIAAFAERFGPLRSVAAHGDTRVPFARNLDLLDGVDVTTFGVRHDANLALRSHDVATWLTDRSAAEGSWGDRKEPRSLLVAGTTPMLCLTHPNNWVSGPALWRDRILRRALPARPGKALRVRRTRSDRPATAVKSERAPRP